MLIQIQEPEEENSKVCALGIDLGTTHTLVATACDGHSEVLTLPTHTPEIPPEERIPSLVAYDANGWVAGWPAYAVSLQTPEHCLHSLKRLMGVPYSARTTHHFPATLAKDRTHGLVVKCGDRALSPRAFSTHLLSHLKHLTQEKLGYTVDQAVITVPAYFDERARQVTRDAAEDAGFKVLRLISEPTAAALAYGIDTKIEGVYGVYDLGGGTFDFSLLKMTKGVFQVLGTGGSTTLGGDDVDAAIVAHFLGEHWHTTTKRGTLLRAARSAKEQLTTLPFTTLKLQGAAYTLSRETLAQLLRPLVEQSLKYVQDILQDTGHTPTELCGIILVGGSTRTPYIQQRVTDFFQKQPLCSLNPDHVVALGAALQAEALTYGAQHLLLDVTPLSLGIETMGNLVETIITRNTRIPVQAEQVFTTHAPNQTKILIHILQGEGGTTGTCRSLAHFELCNIPPRPAGEARIRVRFSLDTDGILTVQATEESSGSTEQVQVKPAYDLTPDRARQLL